MIKIDGISYNAEWVSKSFKLTADILNGDNSGRLQGTKSMYLDYVGTFFNSGGKIRRSKNCTDSEWDTLFLALANPINNHTIEVPFLQGKLTTEIYVSKVETTLIRVNDNSNVWESAYDVTYTSMDSQWLAGGTLQGYTEGI